MIVCPVCEHTQAQGAECEVCGKKLLHGAAAIPFVPPVEGLEHTRHADVDASAPLLPELEPTRQAAVEAWSDPAPDLDPGRAAPVDVADDPVPDLERSQEGLPADAPTAVPAIVTCRYCRTPSLPGEHVCGRCGMRLPVFEERAPEAEPAGRRCGCGALVTGPLCPICGARLA
ncbi:MAG TPA: hypothetical protein VIV57_14375 [Anaeromyxobacter sp.]